MSNTSPPTGTTGPEWSADKADWLDVDDDALDPTSLIHGDSEVDHPAARRGKSGVDAGTSQPDAPPAAPRRPTRKERRRHKRERAAAGRRARKAVPRWRGRVLPKSILGISLLMLAAGLGAAASGTVLYMNYQHRADISDAKLDSFDRRAEVAAKTVEAEGNNARRRIQDEIEPIRKLAATGDTLRSIVTKVGPSIWQIATFDVNGAPSAGTAFVVASDDSKSYLLSSLSVVRSSTADPGPTITVRQDKESYTASLWTWDDARDLALLIVEKPNLPRLEWGLSTNVRLGQQVFAVSGYGTGGGAITQGFIANVSAEGILHSSPLGQQFRGGPLLTDQGQVLAIASRDYAPLGFASDGVYYAPPVRAACDRVLKCPSQEVTGTDQVTGPGDQPG